MSLRQREEIQKVLPGVNSYPAGVAPPARIRDPLRKFDGFLRAHGVNEGTTPAEFAREQEDLDRLGV